MFKFIKRFVNQSHNKIENGDIVSGDKHEYHTNTSELTELSKKLKYDDFFDDQQEIIDDLNEYLRFSPGNENQRDLAQKLSAANLSELLKTAKMTKEKFHKEIYRHSLSIAAQKFFIQILSCVYVNFNNIVYPSLLRGEDLQTITNLIQIEIVDKIHSQIASSEFNITQEHILGMLYFLTGNCYIDWD